jgi:hypothetical protein
MVAKMDNYILVGNGLNRCLSGGIPWGNLLEKISAKYKVSYNPDIVMPLEFERIVNEYLANCQSSPAPNDVMIKIKNDVADIVSNAVLTPNAVHHELKNLEVNGFFTTNYDLLLEKVFDTEYAYRGPSKKYLFNETGRIDSKRFYHLHGIVAYSPSLCLGYEHYMGIVENIRHELNTKKNHQSTEMNIKRILCKEDPEKETWSELFYTSNIGIIGLELSSTESDLWWLITHRAWLYYSDYCYLKSMDILNNTIVYYDVLDGDKKSDSKEEEKRIRSEFVKKNKHELLKNEHVEVKTFTLGKDCNSYGEAYTLMIKDIQENGIGGDKHSTKA